METPPTPVEVFYSYAEADAHLLERLEKHLSMLQNAGVISTWHRNRTAPGDDWQQERDQHLNTANLILFLISPDFLASNPCEIEMQRALQRHEAGEARVIPIALRPCNWEEMPFGGLRALPQNARPVTTWPDRDLAFKDIAIQLRSIVEKLRSTQHSTRISEQVYGQLKNTLPLIPQVLSEFRRCQKKVSELKSVHNMLHEIEVQLEGLSATIQLISRDERWEKRMPRKKGISQYSSDFKIIEIIWRQVVLKIDDLAYFASEVMEVLEDERLSFDPFTIRGASWIKELFILQRSVEAAIRGQDRDLTQNLSNELHTKCRSHLYRIDRRLLEAAKELDFASDLILKDRA